MPLNELIRDGNAPIFFVGPRKTGTSSFYEVLVDTKIPITKSVKETFFFENESIELSEYNEKFGINCQNRFIEVSPSYFANEKALIKDTLINSGLQR